MKVNNTLTKISKYFFTGKLLSKQMETPLQRLEWIYNHFDTNASDIERRYKDLDPLGKFTKQSLYNIEKGDTKSITVRNAEVLKEVFPELNMVWLTTGLGNKLTENRNVESETPIKFNPTLTDVNKRLKEVIGKKTDEGFIPDNVGLVKCFTTVIPISGQAGLHQVMYDSEYISQK